MMVRTIWAVAGFFAVGLVGWAIETHRHVVPSPPLPERQVIRHVSPLPPVEPITLEALQRHALEQQTEINDLTIEKLKLEYEELQFGHAKRMDDMVKASQH